MRAVWAAGLALGLALWPGVAAPAWADDPAAAPALSDGDRTTIVRMIRDQLAAFRRDDAPAAFAFASPGIQGAFDHDATRFMAMVRTGYPPVYRPRSTAFGEVGVVDGQTVEKVEITGDDGQAHTALYTLEREADGSWRISGCALVDGGSVGA